MGEHGILTTTPPGTVQGNGYLFIMALENLQNNTKIWGKKSQLSLVNWMWIT